MRVLERNWRTFYYCQYIDDCIPDDEGTINYVTDECGNQNGEVIPRYSQAQEYRANISPANGTVQAEMFGDLEQYDRVIVTGLDCPINEHSVLFIDKEPEYTDVTTHEYDDEGELVEKTYPVPAYDYIVRRVGTSLNSKVIAVRKVAVS